MKFNSFPIQNHLYQLKFLANLYFNKPPTNNQNHQINQQFKFKILGGFVKYKLKVLGNIMHFRGWEGQLEEARIEVGFEILKTNPKEGVDILSNCSKIQASTFISKLDRDANKINIL